MAVSIYLPEKEEVVVGAYNGCGISTRLLINIIVEEHVRND